LADGTAFHCVPCPAIRLRLNGFHPCFHSIPAGACFAHLHSIAFRIRLAHPAPAVGASLPIIFCCSLIVPSTIFAFAFITYSCFGFADTLVYFLKERKKASKGLPSGQYNRLPKDYGINKNGWPWLSPN
jgi:hypothetical protein